MSKTAKVLIVAGALILLGILVGGAGLIFGGWNAMKVDYERNSQSFSEPVTALDISTISDEIILLPAEDGCCTVTWLESIYYGYDVMVENGVLQVHWKDKEQKVQFGVDDGSPHEVTIALPEREYERLTLTSVSGAVASKGFSFEETQIASVSGAVGLGDGNFGTAVISTTSGDVVLDRVNADDLKIESVSGSIIGTVSEPKTFDVRTISGKQSLPEGGEPAGHFEIRTTSGDIKLEYTK